MSVDVYCFKILENYTRMVNDGELVYVLTLCLCLVTVVRFDVNVIFYYTIVNGPRLYPLKQKHILSVSVCVYVCGQRYTHEVGGV
jgi:hypothetical protein